MAQAELIFTAIWQEQETDCRKCDACEDIIVSKMYSLMFKINNDPLRVMAANNATICESCMNEINK